MNNKYTGGTINYAVCGIMRKEENINITRINGERRYDKLVMDLRGKVQYVYTMEMASEACMN